MFRVIDRHRRGKLINSPVGIVNGRLFEDWAGLVFAHVYIRSQLLSRLIYSYFIIWIWLLIKCLHLLVAFLFLGCESLLITNFFNNLSRRRQNSLLSIQTCQKIRVTNLPRALRLSCWCFVEKIDHSVTFIGVVAGSFLNNLRLIMSTSISIKFNLVWSFSCGSWCNIFGDLARNSKLILYHWVW